MTLSEARRWQHSPDPEVRAAAERRLGARSASRARTAPRRKAGADEKRLEREAKNARTADVRLAVWHRMNPFGAVAALCECGCGRLVTWNTFQMDHWIGAASRTELTNVENCWGLTSACHEDKGGPEVDKWNEKRAAFCARVDLPFTPRKPTRYYARASSVRRAEGTKP